MSTWTDQANAFTSGFGPSTHVVLWDTLLDGRFTRGEIDVVVAHELGHVQQPPRLKGIAWFALLVVLPTLWLVAVATRRRGGIADPANLPLAMLVLAVIGLLRAPLQNASRAGTRPRRTGARSKATRDPAAMQKLFQSFAADEPRGARTRRCSTYLWLETHPTLMQRIAMAEQWRARNRGEPGKSLRLPAVAGWSRAASWMPLTVVYFDQESWSASSSSRANCCDMLTRATTTPGTSPSSTSWSMRANVSVNS